MSAIRQGTQWGGRQPSRPARHAVRWAALAAVAAAAVGLSLPAPAHPHAGAASRSVRVVVQGAPAASGAVTQAVLAAGGRVLRPLRLLDGVVAAVPRAALARLRAAQGIRHVWLDGSVTLHDVDWGATSSESDPSETDPSPPDGGSPQAGDGKDGGAGGDPEELRDYYLAPKAIGARRLWRLGVTGAGVDVALIDSGVVPVDGIADRLVYGPDLSFESQSPDLANLDGYGHGTHMAGIIAGSSTRDDSPIGVAPGARVVSVKVATATGVVDVSQVLAAIDWVVQNRDAGGLHIRVLNLSFGTDSEQSYVLDPLAYAVEQAWKHGIVVVVAAGNSGFGSPRLNDPAIDPYVIAVGATDPRGSYWPGDDGVPPWSSRGDATRRPDVLGPGTRILSLRDEGSSVDRDHPEGLVGSRFFRGSGTSEATAAVSGLVALLLQLRPDLSPDEVKALLRRTGTPIDAGIVAQAPRLDGSAVPGWPEAQSFPEAQGTGSLDAARGSERVVDDGIPLDGERDIFGASWDAPAWAAASAAASAWDGPSWNGNTWIGTWSALPWSGIEWLDGLSSSRWSGSRWSGGDWSSSRWSGSRWSGAQWSSQGWGE